MKKIILLLIFFISIGYSENICPNFELPPQFSIKTFSKDIIKKYPSYIIQSDSFGVDYIEKYGNIVLKHRLQKYAKNVWDEFNAINYLAACGNTDAMVAVSNFYEDKDIKNYWLIRAAKLHNTKAISKVYSKSAYRNAKEDKKVAFELLQLYKNTKIKIIKLKIASMLMKYKKYFDINKINSKDINDNPYIAIEHIGYRPSEEDVKKLYSINITEAKDILFNYFLYRDKKLAEKYYQKKIELSMEEFKKLYPYYYKATSSVIYYSDKNMNRRAIFLLELALNSFKSDLYHINYEIMQDKAKIKNNFEKYETEYNTILKKIFPNKIKNFYNIKPSELYKYLPKSPKKYSKDKHEKFALNFEKDEQDIYNSLEQNSKDYLIYIFETLYDTNKEYYKRKNKIDKLSNKIIYKIEDLIYTIQKDEIPYGSTFVWTRPIKKVFRKRNYPNVPENIKNWYKTIQALYFLAYKIQQDKKIKKLKLVKANIEKISSNLYYYIKQYLNETTNKNPDKIDFDTLFHIYYVLAKAHDPIFPTIFKEIKKDHTKTIYYLDQIYNRLNTSSDYTNLNIKFSLAVYSHYMKQYVTLEQNSLLIAEEPFSSIKFQLKKDNLKEYTKILTLSRKETIKLKDGYLSAGTFLFDCLSFEEKRRLLEIFKTYLRKQIIEMKRLNKPHKYDEKLFQKYKEEYIIDFDGFRHLIFAMDNNEKYFKNIRFPNIYLNETLKTRAAYMKEYNKKTNDTLKDKSFNLSPKQFANSLKSGAFDDLFAPPESLVQYIDISDLPKYQKIVLVFKSLLKKQNHEHAGTRKLYQKYKHKIQEILKKSYEFGINKGDILVDILQKDIKLNRRIFKKNNSPIKIIIDVIDKNTNSLIVATSIDSGEKKFILDTIKYNKTLEDE